MKIALFAKVFNPNIDVYVQHLIDTLIKENVSITVFKGFADNIMNSDKQFEVFNSYEEIVEQKVSFLFSLGGDGTLLDAILFVRDSNIPVAGINMGRLGFLANIAKEDIDLALKAILKKSYELDKRSLLHLESGNKIFGSINFALNDFTIHKKETSSMITIHTYIDGEYLNSYWADGLVVATPTGSTAYALSCGGPILFPDTKSFVIAPVAPHNMNVRPVVVSDSAVISFKIEEGRGEKFLCSLDSRFETIDSSYKLVIRKEKFSINLIRLRESDFPKTLRNKLMWGMDKRN